MDKEEVFIVVCDEKELGCDTQHRIVGVYRSRESAGASVEACKRSMRNVIDIEITGEDWDLNDHYSANYTRIDKNGYADEYFVSYYIFGEYIED